MRLIFLLAILDQGAIAGTVREDPTLTPVPYATVEIVELRRSTTTDEDGYYVFPGVPDGTWTLRASALGYLDGDRAVALARGAGARVDFLLATDPVDVQGLRVRVQRAEVVGPPPVRIDLATVKRAPAYAEPDVLRVAQMVPAVQAISDFSSALHVRGGAPDQTLVTLDGIPLFNPYHAGGMLSAFSPEAVESVEVVPGGLGAGTGDRLSGMVAIRTRDAERDRYHLEGGLGLLSLRTTVSGPLPGGAGLVVAGRRTFAPLRGAIHARGMIPRDLDHGFSDLLVRASRDIGPGGSVTLTAYADAEGFQPTESFRGAIDYDWDWGSRVAGLRLRYPLTPSLQAEVRGAISTFRTSLTSAWRDGLQWEHTLDGEGRMRDALAAAEATWHGRIHTLRLGGQVDDYRFRYRTERGTELAPGSPESYVPTFRRSDELTTLAAWVEEEIRPVPALAARAGVRLLDAGSLGRVWMPRVGARLDLGSGLALTASAGRYAQAVHSLRSTEASLASLVAYEVYAAAEPATGLATADEVTAGLTWFRGRTSLQLDGYLRELESLSLAPLPSDPLTAPVLVPEGRVTGTGRARGLEVLLRHVRGEGGAWISYSLLYTDRTQEGRTYAPRFERRHFVDAMVIVPFSDRTTGSVRMMVGSGQPYTPTVGVLYPSFLDPEREGLVDGGHMVGLLGQHNSARLRAYVRGDVGVRHVDTKVLGRDVTLRPYVQILNATLADNELERERPAALLPPCSSGDWGLPSCVQQSTDQLPIILSAGIEWVY
ncbi:MAG: TonB-dependent receptor [Gemmatimonadetes bacterium]|nr:TonB-dependent receptor [Gemmatimonadota bacterium]NIQ54571.1 TonB-dependent receptor [Gemmatimonadota bacterium]NIU74774.1 TonB-dependent receptor [Gammaproteobacteria bacterium]NIX44680.1 TonB-dependent receptor [Gemmatimonadota bacterium]NIY08915.1 TonB-dependent receptor [Gemmatimonadota bacterium]